MRKSALISIIFAFLFCSCGTSHRETRKADPENPKYAPLEKVKPGNNFQNQR